VVILDPRTKERVDGELWTPNAVDVSSGMHLKNQTLDSNEMSTKHYFYIILKWLNYVYIIEIIISNTF